MLACPALQPITFVPLSQHTNAELYQEGEAIFNRFNNDSLYLDRFGIKCALTALHGTPPTQAQLYRVATLAGSKGLDLKSWIDYVTEWKQTESPREQSRATFRILDKSCSGFISRSDWHAAVKSVAPHIHPFVVDDAFDAVDSNHDGRIDCDEFVALMAAINIYH